MNATHIIRQPAVSGQFYRPDPDALEKQVSDCLVQVAEKEKAIAIVSPHAGLMYSGQVAGRVYSRVVLPRTVILVGPNHTGLGAPVSVFPGGKWRMPHGDVTVEGDLGHQILERFPQAQADTQAHKFEHCLEVQLPFLQHFQKDVRMVPIVMRLHDLASCQQLGSAMAASIQSWGEPVLLIASTDMTHYEPDEIARNKDRLAIERITALDPKGLHDTVRMHHISMCGFAPTVAVLFAALQSGSTQAEMIHYMTSGEVSGDYEHVVGYAGIIMK